MNRRILLTRLAVFPGLPLILVGTVLQVPFESWPEWWWTTSAPEVLRWVVILITSVSVFLAWIRPLQRGLDQRGKVND